MPEFQVEQYHPHDFLLTDSKCSGNPFLVEILATFTHESGERIENLPGFYNGDNEWKIRFSPPKIGKWTGKITRSDRAGFRDRQLGPFECVASTNPRIHGQIGTDSHHEQKFAWQDGTPFVAMGFECDWLFSYHQADEGRFRRHVDLIAERGFNYIVTNVYAHTGFSRPDPEDDRSAPAEFVFGPPDFYVFEGTNDSPNHLRLNTEFFQKYDRLVSHLHAKGMVAHIMIQVQNKHVKWPLRRSIADNLFWNHVVSRYQAYGNVIWDIGKESYHIVNEMGNHDYILDRIALIRGCDAYEHLITVHDPARDSASRLSPCDKAADLISDQVHLADVSHYNREAINRLRSTDKPYINIEYGYELGAEDLKTYGSRTTIDWREMLKWTYAIFMGGAYPCYYYSNTAWDLIKFEPEPPGWSRYRILRDILDGVHFNRLTADNDLVESGCCLAELNSEYLVFLPEGGDTVIDLAIVDLQTIPASWIDIFSGERKEAPVNGGKFCTELKNPFGDKSRPCVVLLKVPEDPWSQSELAT